MNRLNAIRSPVLIWIVAGVHGYFQMGNGLFMFKFQEEKETEIVYQPVQSESEDIERILTNAFNILFAEAFKNYQNN